MTKIILSLDTIDSNKIHNTLKHWPESGWVKIGLESFVYHGPKIRKIVGENRPFFLDLKFKDIPNTVSKAILASKTMNPQMLTIHLADNQKMVEESVEAAETINTNLVGIIKLSSTKLSWRDNSFDISTIKKYQKWGINTLVVPPWIWQIHHEIREFMQENKITSVVPGVRPGWMPEGHDHAGVISLTRAFEMRTDFVVMGRPLLEIEPKDMLKFISNEVG